MYHPGAASTPAAWMLVALSAVVGGCASDAYEVPRNLSYDPTLGVHGTFDFYEPQGDSVRTGRPAIIAIHGGAWKGGDKVWGQHIAEGDG